MRNDNNESFIAAVDLGTSKIALAVAKVDDGNVQILYYNTRASDGIRNSEIYSPVRVLGVLRGLIHDAEEELKLKILQVFVGLPRCGVRQEKAEAICQRTNPDDYISEEEIDSLKSLAQDNHQLRNPEKEMVYSSVAQAFSTPEFFQINENDIVGMISTEITGHFNVFVGKRFPINYIYKVFNDLHIGIADTCFTPVAVAKAVLSEDEMQNGVALIDLGAGSTSVSVYKNNSLVHYASIPFGGSVVSSDIRSECSISDSLAENIKCAYGGCMPDKLQNLGDKIVQIETDDISTYKQIPLRYISEIITARENEIVDAMLYEILESGLAESLRKGIVITGGGAEMLNLANFIQDISGYKVRVASPRNYFLATGCERILKPAAAAIAGMVLMAKNARMSCCTLQDGFVAGSLFDKVEEQVEKPVLNDNVEVEEIVGTVTEESAETRDDVKEKVLEEPVKETLVQDKDVKDDVMKGDKKEDDKKDDDSGDNNNGGKGFFKDIVWKFKVYYNKLSEEKA